MLPLTSNSIATLTPARSRRKSVIGRVTPPSIDLEIARGQVLDEPALLVADHRGDPDEVDARLERRDGRLPGLLALWRRLTRPEPKADDRRAD